MSDVAKVVEEIQSLKQDLAELKQANYKTQGGTTPGKVFATSNDHAIEGRNGFTKGFGEYLVAVKNAASGRVDNRLVQKAVSGMDEGIGADGGFLIPPEFSNNIFQRVYSNDIIKRTDNYTVSGNTMTFPAVDETSRATGSRYGGVRGFWMDEAGQISSSKPKFRRIQLVLHKLACLGYITDELFSDASVSLDQYLTRVFAGEIEFLVGDSIFNGDGVGKPQGVLNSGAVVSVAKETGQVAASIVYENIQKMWARLYAPSQSTAAWFINQDTIPQLSSLSLGIGVAGVAAYLPPGGLSGAPYATLMGKPVIVTEFQKTIGTQGDIVLADLTQYLTISKGSAQTEMSMHLRFDFDEMAYRVIFRVDGKSWWNAPLTPFNGSNTQSPFVVLDTRA